MEVTLVVYHFVHVDLHECKYIYVIFMHNVVYI